MTVMALVVEIMVLTVMVMVTVIHWALTLHVLVCQVPSVLVLNPCTNLWK